MSKPHISTIRGHRGKLYDYRNTGLLPANGGRITPLIFVEHIPVIRNVPGVEDFETLARVLRQQGLSLQMATDSEGNIALFNNLNRLCFQARGANAISCGCEHMHLTIGEPWTGEQMEAAAYLAARAQKNHGIPLQNAHLISGPGIVKVARRGHTTHAIEARAAQFFDRIDPGPGFHRQRVYELAHFYERHGRF